MANITGEVLQLVTDFVKYAEMHPEDVVDIMWYNIDGFKYWNKR